MAKIIKGIFKDTRGRVVTYNENYKLLDSGLPPWDRWLSMSLSKRRSTSPPPVEGYESLQLPEQFYYN